MKHKSRKKAYILLADGTIFYGKSIGIEGKSYGEICFNTGMTGYQEIFTDPSYFGQIMVTTNAHIGNYGVLNDEAQSDIIAISGLVCKNFSFSYSRVKSKNSLFNYLNKNKIITISDVDTRALVSYIRENGAMNAVISTDINTIEDEKKKLNKIPRMEGLDLASIVSTKSSYFFGNSKASLKVAVLDLGIKKNILTNMANRDMYMKVFPYNTKFETMESWNPDGYFLSNGPGDPEPLKNAIDITKLIIKKNYPLFGICLGHQVIALANGVSTYKMFNGHRGINHPVKNLITSKGEITSQNHGFAVVKEEAESHPDILITHIHLNDETVAGMKMKSKNCFSVQYHPEAGPGPNDATYLFDIFYKNMKKLLTN